MRERRKEPLPRRIEAALAALLPEYPRSALAVALSGGLDSTVLLVALAGLKRRPPLRALHIDHGLHPSSGAWASHCRALAARLAIPLTIAKVEVRHARGASLEAAAREARYAALAAALGAGEVLLTAQHADDQLETVLLQLLRGAGLRGLAAMPAVAPFGRGRIARPLLEMERAELEAWAHEHALEWVEDATNTDERFDRNYLRRSVTPLLRARWPAASRAVSRAARHAGEAQRLLDLLARADVERAAIADALAVTRLRALPEDRRRNALRYWIVQRGHPLPDSRRLAELAGALIAARADAHPEVRWAGSRARREGNRLSLERTNDRNVTDVSVCDLEWYPRQRSLELPAGPARARCRSRAPHGTAPPRRGAAAPATRRTAAAAQVVVAGVACAARRARSYSASLVGRSAARRGGSLGRRSRARGERAAAARALHLASMSGGRAPCAPAGRAGGASSRRRATRRRLDPAALEQAVSRAQRFKALPRSANLLARRYCGR